MDAAIAGILALDGLTNGAVYALMALATVLVFAVTRVIFIPQGEFVAFGALTLALLQTGRVPGTVWFLLVLAGAVVLQDLVNGWRLRHPMARLAQAGAAHAGLSGGGFGADDLGRAPGPAAAGAGAADRWRWSLPSARCCTGWPTNRWPMPACWCC